MVEEFFPVSDFFNIYHMLEDDESKDIFLKRLNYLITGDFRYMSEVISTYQPELVISDKKDIGDLLSALPRNKSFVVYGAGDAARDKLPYFKNDSRFIGFCSRTKKKQQNGYLGYPVMSPEALLSRKDLSVIILTRAWRDEIKEGLISGGYPLELIFDEPRYYADALAEPEQYFSPDFITYEDKEIFVDAGACNLTTSLRLRKHCPRVKVYAFEPDPECYRRCLDRKEDLNFETAKILPFGTWSKRDSLRFQAGLRGASYISETNEGNETIEVMPIDEAIDEGDKVTFIKMDVEGSELESLKGAAKTIRRDRPKLAICIYHKPEDMWTIPLYVKELVPEYKLYIRHHSSSAGETVLYAIMP